MLRCAGEGCAPARVSAGHVVLSSDAPRPSVRKYGGAACSLLNSVRASRPLSLELS